MLRHPRLAATLDAYLRMAEQFRARRMLDIGCGTGVFALLLADRGFEVVGVDPAEASMAVARAKPGGERVRWIRGMPPRCRRCAST